MDSDTFCWVVFVAVLAPLFLRQPTDPIWQLLVQISLCLIMVALADRIERRR
jgi:hypothetical protein